MGLVAVTAGLFALGAYIGRDTSAGWAICWFLVAFGALLAMNVATQRSEQLAIGLLFGFGLLLGLAVAPTVANYVGEDPQAVWLAGGATALFMAGFGAVGYATRRDLSVLARFLLLGAGCGDRVRDRARVRADPGRCTPTRSPAS